MPRIAYLGPEGTFTEAALLQDLGAAVWSPATARRTASRRSRPRAPPAALAAVRSGDADYACVPIENSIEGSVLPTLDSLATGTPLQIFAELTLDVAFTIVVRPGTPAADVATVAAFPVAAAQVRHWLTADTCPSAQVVPANSNAAAAHDVANGRADAGVSTALAAERYGLTALAADVVDEPNARTRFVLAGPPGPPPGRTGADRTSVVLRLDNVPGALVSALTEFAIRDIDLTRIESRPTRTELGTYIFFLDCVGHIDDDAVAEALKALHRRCADVRYLGSWPTGSAAGAVPPRLDEASRWLTQADGSGESRERSAGAGPARTVARQRRPSTRHPAARGGADRPRPRPGPRLRPRPGRTAPAMIAHSVAVRAAADRRRDRRRARRWTPTNSRASTRFRSVISRTATTTRRSSEFNTIYQRWHEGDLDVPLPGGETGHEVLDRYVPVLTQLRMRYLDDDAWHGDIVVVSHGAAIRLVSAVLAGVDGSFALDHHLANTESVVLSPITDGRWSCVQWATLTPPFYPEPDVHPVEDALQSADPMG